MPRALLVNRPRALIVGLGAALLLLAWAIFLGWRQDEITACFGERDLVTWTSTGVLLAIAYLCFRLFRVARDDKPRRLVSSPALVWLLMAVGFLYLAVDETIGIHESLDHLIHDLLGREETAMSDRLDDLIVGAYGLVGLGFLWFYRHQLARASRALPIMVLGFAFMAAMVVGDLASNGEDFVGRFISERDEMLRIIEWIEVAEDSCKLLAETCFLVAAYVALRQVGGTLRWNLPNTAKG